MIGIIDVGGGLRDIYGAGVFDRLSDDSVPIDYCIGVSAGSANIASFVAKQRGRNLPFYLDYPARREYMSAGNVLKKGSYLDLGYVYGTLSKDDGENPVDYDTMLNNPTRLVVVVTDAETGEARYFEKSDAPRNDYRIFMASSCLPVFCRPIEIDGHFYYDGGLSDPVPVQKAFDDGCDKVILILSKPLDAPTTGRRDAFGARAIRGKYPNAAAALLTMAEKYRTGVELALQFQKEGKLLLIAPDDTGGVKTLTKDPVLLKALYDKGYADAGKAAAFCAGE
ncbi:MAG: patatin family protein [Clostridia bacterium]|nr:patatin family protein [Clostridia bacterium]